MVKTVEELFTKCIPPEVWHYTTLRGIEGILSSNKVWATDAAFTTDSSEFVHARDVAVKFLHAFAPADEHIAFAIAAALELADKAFEEGALSRKHTQVFIASFSAAPDLKSQWMEYADAGQGASVGFDLRSIRPPADLNLGITFAPCVYATEEKEQLVKAALAGFIGIAAKHHRQSRDFQYISGQMRTFSIIERLDRRPLNKDEFMRNLTSKISAEIRQAALRTTFNLLRLASHCKDESFRQEEEWRLALPRSTSKPLVHTEIEFRGSRGNIPYLATNLFQDTDRLPVTRVMLGPFCRDTAKVEAIVKAAGYSVPIIPSAIPLRRPEDIR